MDNPILATSKDILLDISHNYYFVDANKQNVTVTLPQISSDGVYHNIIRSDDNVSNTVTIKGFDAGQTISYCIKTKVQNPIISCNDLWYTI